MHFPGSSVLRRLGRSLRPTLLTGALPVLSRPLSSASTVKFLRLIRLWAFVATLCVAATDLRGAEAGAPMPGDFAVRTWGKAQGLIDDSVSAILQARDGFLWIGTASGLVRFDGVRFTEVPLVSPARPVRVTALCESGGGLWIGTQQDGLFCLTNGVTLRYGTSDGLADEGITSLAADVAQSLWIGTRAGLNRRTDGRFSFYATGTGPQDGFVSGIHIARSGTVWITTRSGLSRLRDGRIEPYEFMTDSQGRSPEFLGAYEDRRGNLWGFGDTYLINLTEEKRFNYFRGAEAPSVRIWSLCEGRDGRLWIGTSGRGLFCFDGSRFLPVSMNELNPPTDVRAIAEDREGNLWLGTAGGGLTQLTRRSVTALRLPSDAVPTSVAAGSGGRVYVALDSGGVLVREGGRFEEFSDLDGRLERERVVTLGVGFDGTVWAGTSGSGLFGVREGRAVQFTTANGLSDDSVTAICTDTAGTVWVGTRAGALHRVDRGVLRSLPGTNALPGPAISALAPSREGGLWAALEGGQLFRIRENQAPVSPERRRSPGRRFTSLHEGRSGRLWAGTDGDGLLCFQGGNLRNWTTRDGLPDDRVLGAVEDANGNLWLLVRRGLLRIGRESVDAALESTERFTLKPVFDADAPGLGPVPEGWPGIASPADGSLWFATAQGLMVANTADWADERQRVPVYIEQILVNGRELSRPGPGYSERVAASDGQPMRLSADLGSLDVHFTALGFNAPEKLRFRHKLEGFDPDWVHVGTERKVHYARLPYGEYRLRIATSAGGDVWDDTEASFAFVVPVPMWRSSWAISLYVFFAAGSVAGVARIVSHRRLRHRLALLEQQQAMERERMRIAQDMHDEIGSKLTKLSFLSERARAEVPDTNPLAGKIGSIAVTSRELLQTLDEIVWAVNPRNDSLEHLAVYLGQYATEYFTNTAVECELRLPRQIPHHPLSAETRHNLFLAFEEALNNVLKHSGATRVKVDMSISNIRFEIVVADNGTGFDVEAVRNDPAPRRGGNGLGNMQDRLAKTGGRCLLRSRPGEGATVILSIPLDPPADSKK